MPSRILRTIAIAVAIVSVCLAAAMRPHAQAPSSVRVVKVVGDGQKLALQSDGSVIGWGRFNLGQLGPIAAVDPAPNGFGTTRPVRFELSGKAIDVAARNNTSYALLEDGTVWAWGDGRDGALGTGSEPKLPILSTSTQSMQYRGAERPVRVAVSGVKNIYAGEVGAVALLEDGTLRAWPSRRSGASAFAPVAIDGLHDVIAVAPSGSHVVALTKDGRVWTWGNNRYGALGREPKQDSFNEQPAPVPDLSGVTGVAAADDVSFALKSDGTVWVWGTNGQGQFGNGQRASHPSVDTQSVPQRVPGVANVVAISAATNGRHVMALLKDGTLRAWGNTDWGQIGAGVSATFQLSPVTPKIANVKSIFTAGNNTFAVKNDGTLWGWGAGGKGQWPFDAHTKLPAAITIP